MQLSAIYRSSHFLYPDTWRINRIYCISLLILLIFSPHFGHPQVYVSMKYRCALSFQMLQVDVEDSGKTLAKTTNPTINDDECNRPLCSLCEIAAPVRRVSVRGLCELSIFDRSFAFFKTPFHLPINNWVIPVLHMIIASRVYNYIINEDGQPVFVGSHTSVLFYNRSISSWVW